MIILVTVLFITAIVQSVFGFGQGLLAVPLLIGLFPLPVLVPLLGLVSLTIAASVVHRSPGAVDRSLLGVLVASAAIGVPAGVWLVGRIDEATVRACLGTLLVFHATQGLLPLRPRALPRSNTIVGSFGLFAGVLGGALNLMGPPVVVLMQLQRLDPATFRATLHAFSLFVNTAVVTVWFVAADEAFQTLQLYAVCVLPVLAATHIGHRVFARLDARRFRPAVHILIGLAGLRLLLSG